MISTSPKDAMRAFLASKVAEKLVENPDAVTLYAAERAPDPKPYVKKTTNSEQVFRREIEKMREDRETPAPPDPVVSKSNAHLLLDDYPGLNT